MLHPQPHSPALPAVVFHAPEHFVPLAVQRELSTRPRLRERLFFAHEPDGHPSPMPVAAAHKTPVGASPE